MTRLLAVAGATIVALTAVAPAAMASDHNYCDSSLERYVNDDCVVKPTPTPTPAPAPPAAKPAAPAAPKGPGPYLQAYGTAEDPTCQLTVAWAKWPGVPDGSWHLGWGQWLNGGKGGPACLRTVTLVGKNWVVS
jgi:hypothetical protein